MQFVRRALLPPVLALVAFVGAVGIAEAANWHISFQKTAGDAAAVTWDVTLGLEYRVCWKLDGTTGDVCAGDHQFTITPTQDSGGYSPSTGRMSVSIGPLNQCGVSYKVRIKRNTLTYDTAVFPFPC